MTNENRICHLTSVSTFRFSHNPTLKPQKRKELPLFACAGCLSAFWPPLKNKINLKTGYKIDLIYKIYIYKINLNHRLAKGLTIYNDRIRPVSNTGLAQFCLNDKDKLRYAPEIKVSKTGPTPIRYKQLEIRSPRDFMIYEDNK